MPPPSPTIDKSRPAIMSSFSTYRAQSNSGGGDSDDLGGVDGVPVTDQLCGDNVVDGLIGCGGGGQREQASQKAEDEIEQERLQMIDWHDFVVVEIIDFADDEDEDLPPPMTLEGVIRRSKMLRRSLLPERLH
ncbi:unnamed protein product [Fraxinus pennsylvanica]|uniref:Splicing factor 3A subunit 1 conserved domain-containing protein n=1 Tax=Fraxinus pennsylvanica TaxID=56036 RepID=A0AAD1ZST4_9LAMI|nr:unnamed protein product [Fraxinus pennsylvanica]